MGWRYPSSIAVSIAPASATLPRASGSPRAPVGHPAGRRRSPASRRPGLRSCPAPVPTPESIDDLGRGLRCHHDPDQIEAGTGLKRCRPRKRAESSSAEASSVTDSDDVLVEVEDVVALLEEQPLVLQRAEPALPGPVLRRRPDAGAEVAQLGTSGGERLEGERAERAAVVDGDRDQRRDMPSSRRASSRSGRPSNGSASVGTSSTAATASCWFAVDETCRPSSYFDQ